MSIASRRSRAGLLVGGWLLASLVDLAACGDPSAHPGANERADGSGSGGDTGGETTGHGGTSSGAGDASTGSSGDGGGQASSGSSNDASGEASVPIGDGTASDAAPSGDATLEAGLGAEGGSTCANAVEGIAVDEREIAGYPSYTIDHCRLVYVAPAAEAGGYGELRLRDLTTGSESVIAPADESPRRPSIAGEIIAWQATLAGKSVVRVLRRPGAGSAGAPATSDVVTVTGPFVEAAEPRACSDAVVFTGFVSGDAGGDSDVFLYLPATAAVVTVASGPGQQRFADVSEAFVAVSDFSEDPDGRYDGDSNDLADIVIYDRATATSWTRKRPDKQAFPMLAGGDLMAYLHWSWSEVHPEPKLSAYHLETASVRGLADGDREIARVGALQPPYVRPAARAGVVEWVDSPGGIYQFWRADLGTTVVTKVLTRPAGATLYAPVPTDAFTVLAERSTAAARATLSSVAR